MGSVTNRDKRLYNSDLAPTPSGQKNWGWAKTLGLGENFGSG